MYQETNLTRLRDQLCQYFTLGELTSLCFDLNINFESLPGQTLDEKARELILYCQRHGRLSDLINRCREIRQNAKWLISTLAKTHHEVSPEAGPSHQTHNFLLQIWDNLDPALQDALTLAYNQARRDGRDTIRTRYFFAAITRLQPEPLSELIQYLPKESLPNPIDSGISTERLLLEENPQLSSCVHDSLTHLTVRITDQEKLSSADVFVDIAKFGTGSSVKRLRTHGVTPELVDNIVSQLGWEVVERD